MSSSKRGEQGFHPAQPHTKPSDLGTPTSSPSGLAGTTLSYRYPTAGEAQVSLAFTITIAEDKPDPVKG